jgi:pimeloyl-ACP methyl ester carboxylesterase/DNA-binding winged helix-turn-helix (wHTH) protein
MRYRFGERVLDTETRELSAGGEPVEVEPQVFDVLAFLLAHRDRVVTKAELLDEVWGDRFVSESALTTRIKQARQAVGDSGSTQAVIKTLHGRGYRVVADVDEDSAHARSQDAAPPRAHAAVSSIPRTRWAEGDGASIAYQSFGEGPDIVFIAGFTTNVEVQWEHPAIAAFLRRMASFARVTVLDKRGVGLSDRMRDDRPPSLETRADDLLAVMDAVDIPSATVLGSSEGGSLSALFAATHPERVDRLILHNTWLVAANVESGDDVIETVSRIWGRGRVLAFLGPSLATDNAGRAVLARLERQAATPRTARLLLELTEQIDLSSALDAITVPTLVIHRLDDPIVPIAQGRELAAHIRNAELVELPDADHWIFSGDVTPLLQAIEAFVTGDTTAPSVTDRVLATVLFVDIVDSTATSRVLGDKSWIEVLTRFEHDVRQVVGHHRGTVIKTTGDGVLATFDGPGRAVQAAGAVRAAAAPLGLIVRAGLHTAEIELRGDDIAGIGVHIASRVADAADPGEILVSRTVTDLVAGTGLRFDDRGEHQLKGLDQRWALYAARI